MGGDGLGRELAPIAIMILVIVLTFVWTAELMIQSTIDMPGWDLFKVLIGGSLEPA